MVKDCRNCKHHTWGDEWWNCKTECSKCKYTDMQGEKVPSNWKPLPQTNADRIRAMTDEELAEWLARTQIDHVAEVLKIACIPWEQHPDLRELIAKDNLEWLKQPAEEGADNG